MWPYFTAENLIFFVAHLFYYLGLLLIFSSVLSIVWTLFKKKFNVSRPLSQSSSPAIDLNDFRIMNVSTGKKNGKTDHKGLLH